MQRVKSNATFQDKNCGDILDEKLYRYSGSKPNCLNFHSWHHVFETVSSLTGFRESRERKPWTFKMYLHWATAKTNASSLENHRSTLMPIFPEFAKSISQGNGCRHFALGMATEFVSPVCPHRSIEYKSEFLFDLGLLSVWTYDS